MSIKRTGRNYTVECDDCENMVAYDTPSLSIALEMFNKANGRTYENSRGETAHQCSKCRRDR